MYNPASWRAACDEGISQQQLLELSALKPELSTSCILSEWLVIAALIALAKMAQHPILTGFAILMIGSRQHSLAILMHEGAHFHLASRRVLNDRLAELFTAWPLLISLPSYRKSHFEHHLHSCTMADPDWRRKQNEDWAFPKSPLQMAMLWLKVFFNLPLKLRFMILIMDLPRFFSWHEWRRELLRALYYLVGVLLVFGLRIEHDVLVYWLIPYCFVFMPIAHLRSIAEHFGLENHPVDPLTQTRTTKASLLESILICPNHINYHLDHHIAPSVPFYNLPALHRLLASSSAYAQRASITQGYWGVIRECTK